MNRKIYEIRLFYISVSILLAIWGTVIYESFKTDDQSLQLNKFPSSGISPSIPRLSGSFIQPYLADSLNQIKWKKEFEYMKDVGLRQLLIQWTADSKNKTTVYPSGLNGFHQNTKNDIIKGALENADLLGIDVFLGLQVNSDWWGYKSKNTNWLRNEAELSIELFEDLQKRYGGYKSLTGWYISFEADNWRFCTRKEWDRLALLYSTVLSHIKSRTPLKPVVIAPFFNPSGGLNPSGWQAMWVHILMECPIDIVALQDGVGAGHTTKEILPEWFGATLEAIMAARPSTKLWSTTESFCTGYKPMPVKKLVEDMEAVKPYVDCFICFSYNHYMSPQQVDPFYHDTYRSYTETGMVGNLPPAVPAAMIAEYTHEATAVINQSESTKAAPLTP